MRIVKIFDVVGDFGEDKDAAAHLRENTIRKIISNSEIIELDFIGVTLVTQSFIHAMISDLLRGGGEEVLDFIEFKNCTDLDTSEIPNLRRA